ncbi:hypothetical protein, partial [Haladaptatus sp.]|uniref:hypothetical protein n=1 Tax=Haladaptatus sp. TaxID=1973141 RepID=UPI003C5EA088
RDLLGGLFELLELSAHVLEQSHRLLLRGIGRISLGEVRTPAVSIRKIMNADDLTADGTRTL